MEYVELFCEETTEDDRSPFRSSLVDEETIVEIGAFVSAKADAGCSVV